jgi:hypothetical protein
MYCKCMFVRISVSKYPYRLNKWYETSLCSCAYIHIARMHVYDGMYVYIFMYVRTWKIHMATLYDFPILGSMYVCMNIYVL